MNMTLIREGENPKHNFGQLYIDGIYFGETLEDEDRFLESDPTAKVQDQTAIPRGRYLVTLSLSKRFGKIMPEVHDVPGFSGVRIHGGNSESNTSGCPLLGSVRTKSGIANCHNIDERLIDLISEALARQEEVWLEVS